MTEHSVKHLGAKDLHPATQRVDGTIWINPTHPFKLKTKSTMEHFQAPSLFCDEAPQDTLVANYTLTVGSEKGSPVIQSMCHLIGARDSDTQ